LAVNADLGRANVAVRATLDQLDKDLAGARNKCDGVLGKVSAGIGKNFLNIGKLAVGGLTAATGAATGLGLALGKIAIDAAPVEGLSQAFDGLAESAGYGADELLDALQRGSSGMVSSRDLMLSFNQAASLISTDFATQLPEAMQYLSKVSASTGTDMGFLLDSLVKGVGRLSPMILDNLAIQVSLAEATDRAAEMFGLQADELDKAQIQAGMMSVTLEKLAANTEAMPDVSDTAAAKMAQFKATMQDTKDEIGMALLPILSTLLTTFSNLAERILPPVVSFIEDTLAPALEGLAQFISNLVIQLGQTEGIWEAVTMAFEGTPFEDLQSGFIVVRDAIQNIIDTVKPYIEMAVEWIAQHVELKDVLIALGATIAAVILPALAAILAPVLGLIATFAGLVAAVTAIRTAWETDWGGIRTTLTEFWENTGKPTLEALWEWLQVNIPVAIETLKGFWEETLKPALEVVWAFITDSLIPAMGEVVTWLAENIPVAIEAAKEFWENTLQPALEVVWAFITESVIPAMETIVLWLGENIPVAVQALADLWENTLKPALEIVWEFVENSLFPLFSALWELLDVSLSTALTALAGLWENVLKPALDTVWAFLDQNVNPTLEDLKGVFDSIASAVETVIGWIKSLTDSLRNIQLPDWLTPGSPTPFELGLWGIRDAMRSLARAEMPTLSMELRQLYEPEMASGVSANLGGQQIVIYGLTIEGVSVQDALGELQGLAA
jgi:phage-related protein